MSTSFALDPRIAADTHRVARWPLCELLLMDDARYPWLILVPRLREAREIIDLDEATRLQLHQETDAAAFALRHAFTPDKLNVAALGNVVAQLHVHVIGRYHNDDAWPAPVWGVHPRLPRDENARAAIIERLAPHLARFHFKENDI